MGRLLTALTRWGLRLTRHIGLLLARQAALLAIGGLRWVATLAALGLVSLWTGPGVAAGRLAARWRHALLASGFPAHEETPVGALVEVGARALIAFSLVALGALACAGLLLVAQGVGR